MRDSGDYEDDEILAEIGNLQLLIAYCYQEEGDTDKASDYYSKLTENKQINGIYQNLILQNNALSINLNYDEFEVEEEKKSNNDNNKQKSKTKGGKNKGKTKGGKDKNKSPKKKEKKPLDPNMMIYKKLLSGKNEDNFSRIGNKQNNDSITELLKTYHNKCILLIRNRDETQFKSTIGQIKSKNPLSEIPLFLKITYHFKNNQYQQCKDILFHHLSSNPNASIKSRLMYIQTLIILRKYRIAIKQLRLLSNEIKYDPKNINILITLAKKLNDTALVIEIMNDTIDYLTKSKVNNELLISLQIKLCRLLIAKNKASEAKAIAQSLYKIDSGNPTYQAMLLLSAIATEGSYPLYLYSVNMRILSGNLLCIFVTKQIWIWLRRYQET